MAEIDNKRLLEALAVAEESQAMLRKAIFGNGGVGLAERVRVLERLADSLTRFRQWVMVGVGGLVVKLCFDMLTWFAERQQH